MPLQLPFKIPSIGGLTIILIGIAGILAVITIILFIIVRKKRASRLLMQKGDLIAIVVDNGTKTVESIPADMISPNIYIGFLGNEPIYIFIPSDKYKFKDKKGKDIVFCEKSGTVVRPINPELESTITAMAETKELKEIVSSNVVQLLYELSKIDKKEGVIPIGTRLNLALSFKPSEILSQILETLITDNVKTFDVITATATTIEKMAKLYQERTRMIQARTRMFGVIPMILIALGVMVAIIFIFMKR